MVAARCISLVLAAALLAGCSPATAPPKAPAATTVSPGPPPKPPTQATPYVTIVSGETTTPPEVRAALIAFFEQWTWAGHARPLAIHFQEISVGDVSAEYLIEVKERYVDKQVLPELQAKLNAYAAAGATERTVQRQAILLLCDKLVRTDVETQGPSGWGLLVVFKQNAGHIVPNTLQIFYDVTVRGPKQWKPLEEMMADRMANPNVETGAKAPFDAAIKGCQGAAADGA